MKMDPGSSYALDAGDISATDDTASLVVDHANAPSASFYIYCKSVATSLDAKLQYSDDGTDYTDMSTGYGNDTSITQLTAAGEAQLNCPNPLGRYTRLLATSVGAVVAIAFSVAGPKRHVAAE